MKKKIPHLLSLIIILGVCLSKECFPKKPEYGVIQVPVADLLGEPIRSFYPSMATAQAYKSLPLCAGSLNLYECCPRVHQALFNQRVTILRRNGNQEVLISLPNAFFITSTDTSFHHSFWTLSSNIISLDSHTACNAAIPADDCLTNLSHAAPTIALKKPWHYKDLNITFSAGTRFVINPSHSNAQTTEIYVPHFARSEICPTTIPNDYCMAPQNPEHRRRAFVSLLKQWSHLAQGIIPYVWGGCSVVQSFSQGDFVEITEKSGKTKKNYYRYAKENAVVKTGLDCAGMVMSAAQIVGIPFYMKNTYTISQILNPLRSDEELEEGDIIFIRGHVMVVADLVNHTLIEARGYPQGYGCIHEIALKDVFEGIMTYKDLRTAEKNKTPLIRKNKKGEKKDTFKSLLLLKLKVE